MTQTKTSRSDNKRTPISTPVQLPETGFIRKKQVLAILGIGQTTLREGILSGAFPAPVKLSPRLHVWDVAVIRNLIERISNGEISLTKQPEPSKSAAPLKVSINLSFSTDAERRDFVQNAKVSGKTVEKYLTEIIATNLPKLKPAPIQTPAASN